MTNGMIGVTKPVWAINIGMDEYGLWATTEYSKVQQRLRYIEPGTFLMGSPDNELGRWEGEQQHRVTLTRGFWLFDTPVTQALWQAVMGGNPSYFQSPARPVESVSWDDCHKFIKKLNGQVPGLDLQLPTEAQWEYACRAGTTTATYVGDLDIKGERNAPLLDGIAWYGGNSGVDFELEKGYDSSGWKEKQYAHEKVGTHPVAQKKPNPWGLYDMHGNVWEWCADWWITDLGSRAVVNPVGPNEGTYRVLRGGGWFNGARFVRAAYRDRWRPDIRDGDSGFRCVVNNKES